MIEDVRARYEKLFTALQESERLPLAPSTIARQFFCEKKVALEREVGDIETLATARGSEIHETVADDAEPSDEDEFWAALERGERQVVLESPFLGEVDEFLLGGSPDAVLFEDQRPQLVVEHKTTSRLDYLFKDQRVQAWLYGYILDSLGLETDSLTIAILRHEQSLDPIAAKNLQREVIREYDAWDLGYTELHAEPEAGLHLSEYATADFIDDLEWALGYWRNERDPKPTMKPAKCRSCEYSEVCSASQTEP
ncbi:PD-(D/E)XK nuclease family protein [Halorientalis brevis]|uniref:PD-(D/E)XK nuclease family protein n=1 Tax=Halorientalis brevis TaxID=1126241 RepID=A0ABD6C8X1_9EURY|nr:PD-(D/E)XK nuclease family protein [Halorientalis brevis]